MQSSQAKKQLPSKMLRFLKETEREILLASSLPSLLQLLPPMVVQT